MLTERAAPRRGPDAAGDSRCCSPMPSSSLHDELLDSAVPDDPYLGRELERYFPAAMRERFPDAIAGHRLRREIIATQLANAIVNRGGPTIVARLVDQTGADAPTIAAAYAATRDSFGLGGPQRAIDALDGVVPGRAAAAPLRRPAGPAHEPDRLVHPQRRLRQPLPRQHHRHLRGAASATWRPACARPSRRRRSRPGRPAPRPWWRTASPMDLAGRLAALPDLVAAPDIVLTARRTAKPVIEIARTHFAVENAFHLGALIGAAREHQRQRLLRPPRPRPGHRRHRLGAPQPHGGGVGAGPAGTGGDDGLERASGARMSTASRAPSTASCRRVSRSRRSRWPRACWATWSRVEPGCAGRHGLNPAAPDDMG